MFNNMIFSSVNNLIINGHPAKRENPHVFKIIFMFVCD